jgi:hypothetical protein
MSDTAKDRFGSLIWHSIVLVAGSLLSSPFLFIGASLAFGG